MKTKIAIYGFDRLGRSVCNVALKRHDLEVVAVYTEMNPKQVIKVLQNDPIYSPIERKMTVEGSTIIIDGAKIALVPKALGLSWQDYDVDVVIDCKTAVGSKKQAEKHEKAGAKRVVFAAPSDDLDTIILGFNEDQLKQVNQAFSAGGAIKSAVLPVTEMLTSAVGIEHTLVTTVNGNTDCCSVSAQICGVACTSDDSCDCIDICGCGELADALALPAPVLVASVSELVFVAKHAVTVKALHESIKKAAAEPYYQGIVTVSEDAIGPDTVIGESYSAVVDLSRTDIKGGRLVSLKIWYDREWAYANRLVELTADFGKTIKKS